jgi:hypothetical protein
VLLVRTADYTATNGTSVVLGIAATASDVVNVVAYGAFNVANTYTQAQANAAFVQNTGYFAAGKNKIINGDFGIWQRGTTFTHTSFAYTADRFQGYSDASQTYSRQTFTPGSAPVAGYEGKYFWRAAKGGTGTFVSLIQYIEDVQNFAGQNMTVSFWAKADSSQTVYIRPAQTFAGGSATVVLNPVTVNVTTSWARYTATFAVPSIAGKTIGATGSTIYIESFIVTNGAVNWDVWGFQAEAGSVATAFQTASGSIGGELALCQRYFQVIGGVTTGENIGSGQVYSSTNSIIHTTFQVPLRTTPSIAAGTGGAATDFRVYNSTGTEFTLTSILGFINPTPYSVRIIPVVASGLTAGNATLMITGSSNGRLFISAEL